MSKRIAHNIISKEDLLADVKKVYDEKPADVKFKLDYYLEQGKYSKAPFKRLGGWNAIVAELDIPLNVHYDATREEMIEDIHRLRSEFGKVTATIQRKHGKYSQKTTDAMFGNFTNMMLAAGYIPSDIAKKMTDEQLLEKAKELYEEHGYLNSSIFDCYSHISRQTYLSRFGTISAIYEKLGINPERNSNMCLRRASFYIGAAAQFFNETPVPEWTTDWLVNPEKNCHLYVDGYFPKRNVAIEYDGEQHFRYVPFLHGHDESKFKRQQKLDRHKNNLLKKNGITVIRFKFNDPMDINFIADKLHKETA